MPAPPVDIRAFLQRAQAAAPSPIGRAVVNAIIGAVDDTGIGYLNQTHLARDLRCTTRAVSDVFRRLRDADVIDTDKKGGPGGVQVWIVTARETARETACETTKTTTNETTKTTTKTSQLSSQFSSQLCTVAVQETTNPTRAIARGGLGLDLNTDPGSLCSPADERAHTHGRDVAMPMSLTRVDTAPRMPALPVAAAGVVAAMDGVVAERFGLRWAAQLVCDAQKWAWCEFGYGVVAPGVVPNEPEPALLWLHDTQRGAWDGLDPEASWFDCGCFMALGVTIAVARWEPGPRQEKPRMARILMPGQARNYPVLQRGLEAAGQLLTARAAAARAAEARARGPQTAALSPPRPEEPDAEVRRRSLEAIFALGKRAQGARA